MSAEPSEWSTRIARDGGLRGNQDFEALGSLVETLNKIASLELKQSVGAARPAASICARSFPIYESSWSHIVRNPI